MASIRSIRSSGVIVTLCARPQVVVGALDHRLGAQPCDQRPRSPPGLALIPLHLAGHSDRSEALMAWKVEVK